MALSDGSVSWSVFHVFIVLEFAPPKPTPTPNDMLDDFNAALFPALSLRLKLQRPCRLHYCSQTAASLSCALCLFALHLPFQWMQIRWWKICWLFSSFSVLCRRRRVSGAQRWLPAQMREHGRLIPLRVSPGNPPAHRRTHLYWWEPPGGRSCGPGCLESPLNSSLEDYVSYVGSIAPPSLSRTILW